MWNFNWLLTLTIFSVAVWASNCSGIYGNVTETSVLGLASLMGFTSESLTIGNAWALAHVGESCVLALPKEVRKDFFAYRKTLTIVKG
jgi:hypothetical protein